MSTMIFLWGFFSPRSLTYWMQSETEFMMCTGDFGGYVVCQAAASTCCHGSLPHVFTSEDGGDNSGSDDDDEDDGGANDAEEDEEGAGIDAAFS